MRMGALANTATLMPSVGKTAVQTFDRLGWTASVLGIGLSRRLIDSGSNG